MSTRKAERVDGRAEDCSFSGPYGVIVHEALNACFIADYRNYVVRKISFTAPV